MYIGEISKKTGLTIKAIRFYEEKGLIKPPSRVGRYRVYTKTDIELLLLIKEAKEFGVTLAELKGIVVYKNGKVDWPAIAIFMQEFKSKLINNMTELQAKITQVDECCAQIHLHQQT